MSRLIIDIETAGARLEDLPETVRQYMLRGAETEEERAEVAETLSFHPHTAEIVAIGVYDPASDHGAVYYQHPGEEPPLPFEEEGIRFISGTEAEIISKFWDKVAKYKSIVTYNGRGFDCPFLLVRSAVHGIKPTKDLMPNRYSSDEHVDLMDRLGFFGSVRRRFSLDIWCHTMGIESPKTDVKGYEVTDMFRAGRGLDIARYCAGDLRATSALYDKWNKFMRFNPRGPR